MRTIDGSQPASAGPRRYRRGIAPFAAVVVAVLVVSARAEDLKEYGRRWNEIQSGWSAEQAHHQQVLDELRAAPQTPETQQRIDAEVSRHTGRSKDFAAQRQVIQDKIVTEANRRTASGQHETSAPGRKTAGTDPAGPKGRGMAGDADYGAGARTADKVQSVLDDMGITTPVKRTPSTIEIGDGLNMTVNKEGRLGPPGSGAHQAQVEVDARVRDTYVSESMGRGQPGRDYVQVQDHKKKALAGLTADPAELPRSPEAAHDMVKGATKSLDHLPADEAEAILRRHGLTPDDMASIKTGQANVTPENAERLQRASREVIEAAETRTRARADAELADSQRRIAELEAGGNKAEARQLREDLVDSRTKIRETAAANAELEAQPRGPVDAPDGPTKGPSVDAPDKPAGGAVDTPEGRAPAADVPDGTTKGVVPDAPDAPARAPAVDAPDAPTKGMAVDTPDAPSRAPAVDAPDAPTKGIAVDAPDAPARAPTVDTPDGTPAAGSTTGSRIRGALDVAGQVMQATDVLSGAQDFKEAALAGDAEGMGRAAVNTLDNVTGGIKGTVDTIVTKGGDYAAAQAALDHANRQHLETQNTRIAIDLQRAGLSKDEVRAILDAKSRGDETALQAAYDRAGLTVPELEVEAPLEGDDSVVDRVGQVVEGMGQKISRSAQFLDETRRDVTEIATGLTEENVAAELVEQQSENLSIGNLREGFGAIVDTIGATLDERRVRDALTDKLTEKGADPAEAAAAAAAWLAGDRSLLDHLRDRLGVPVKPPAQPPAEEKEAEEGQGTEEPQTPPEGPPQEPEDDGDDLREEPDAVGGDDVEPEDAGSAGAVFADGRSHRSQENAAESRGLAEGQQDVSEATTSGEDADREAANIREAGDADAQATLAASTAQTAAEDRKNSVGNALASGVQGALQQGLSAMGTTFGQRAAGAAADAILGPAKSDDRRGDKDKTQEPEDKPPERSSTDDDGWRDDRRDRDRDRDRDKDRDRDDDRDEKPPATASSPPAQTSPSGPGAAILSITCPVCGATRYYVAGTTPPPCRSGLPPLSQQRPQTQYYTK